MYIGAQIYPFMHMYQAAGKELDIQHVISLCADAGYDGWECFLDNTDMLDQNREYLINSGLGMKSAYINLALHEPGVSETEIGRAVELIGRYQMFGIEYLVVNPSPIDWASDENKDDTQLSHQLGSLGRLAERLGDLGVKLAYHTHSSEMRAGAKEQLHMLLNSDPAYVSWCIDCDWIYLGADNSALSVYDWLNIFGTRISMIHVRQITGGVRNQRVESGDIDYAHVRRILLDKGVRPLVVNEQIAGDPVSALNDAEANYAMSYNAIQEIFNPSRESR